MDPARIAELLQPFLGPSVGARAPRLPHVACHSGRGEDSASLSASQLQNISTYIDILLRWNARINLTAIRDPEEIVTRHFGESLFAARRLYPGNAYVGTAAPGCPAEQSSAVRVGPCAADSIKEKGPTAKNQIDLLDLGSGAGFPGIPIKIWASDLSVTLIESNQKKSTFLREIIRALTLTDINVFSGRAEEFNGQAAVVTLRAVERFDAMLPVAARRLAPAGRLALLIGHSQVDRARQLMPSLQWLDPIPVPLSTSRVLLMAGNENQMGNQHG